MHPQNIIDNIGALPSDYLILTKKKGAGNLTTAAKRTDLPKSGLSEALAMLEQKVVAATDVTEFDPLGHLGNMLKTSSTTHN